MSSDDELEEFGLAHDKKGWVDTKKSFASEPNPISRSLHEIHDQLEVALDRGDLQAARCLMADIRATQVRGRKLSLADIQELASMH